MLPEAFCIQEEHKARPYLLDAGQDTVQGFNLICQFIYHHLAPTALGFLWTESPEPSRHDPMAKHPNLPPPQTSLWMSALSVKMDLSPSSFCLESFSTNSVCSESLERDGVMIRGPEGAVGPSELLPMVRPPHSAKAIPQSLS